MIKLKSQFETHLRNKNFLKIFQIGNFKITDSRSKTRYFYTEKSPGYEPE